MEAVIVPVNGNYKGTLTSENRIDFQYIPGYIISAPVVDTTNQTIFIVEKLNMELMLKSSR